VDIGYFSKKRKWYAFISTLRVVIDLVQVRDVEAQGPEGGRGSDQGWRRSHARHLRREYRFFNGQYKHHLLFCFESTLQKT